ncbi:hypothetical protein MTR_1g052305 [Medicago truncatula]|uniref:Uncharacterized protein n=1 Tax=Medicago truncatula TaxID=3880 RepID=A0A072VHQ5_MEDTR|nr:hypothetical protein MTR_1g052305 [Medicago truncatula]
MTTTTKSTTTTTTRSTTTTTTQSITTTTTHSTTTTTTQSTTMTTTMQPTTTATTICICQTKSIGKLTKLSTTFMFTPKANSKQKRVKKTQEHEIGQSATEHFARRTNGEKEASGYWNDLPGEISLCHGE